jgi:DNA-binding CsgD family transcriptional regulator
MSFPADQAQLFAEFAHAAVEVDSTADFTALIAKFVQPLLPHGLLLAVVGQLDFEHLRVHQHIAINYPKEIEAQLVHPINIRERPLLQRWLHTRAPVIACTQTDVAQMSERERFEAQTFNLGRLALHGLPDLTSRMGSYFSFAQVTEDLSSIYLERVLKVVTPLLHVALTQATWCTQPGITETYRLTGIELELLTWVAAGRSNEEMARLRARSPATIRNQLATLYRKLGVSSRAEAAALLLSGVIHVPSP